MAELVRGTRAQFEAEFLDMAGQPMVAADPASWPQLVIKDPDDTVIVTGVGAPLGLGKYRFSWFVPVDAALTTDETAWRIDWSMVTSTGHSHAWTERFAVVDRIESTPEERQQTYLTNDGGTIRALLRWPQRLYKIKLEMRTAAGSEILLSADGVATNALEEDASNPQRLINEKAQDGEYIYYYDVCGLSAGEYQFHWIIQESEISPIDLEVQIGRAAPGLFWHYNVELRMLVDKLQKHSGMVQAYSDSDIYSYVKGGLGILNFYPPPTNFSLQDIPLTGSRGLRTALIYTSAIHAINAQQIMEVELNFDHSGQTVTLNYNHDYSGVLGNLAGVLEKYAEAKAHIFRLSQGAAFSGARVKNYRYTNRVYRLNQTMRGVVPPGGAALWKNLGI